MGTAGDRSAFGVVKSVGADVGLGWDGAGQHTAGGEVGGGVDDHVVGGVRNECGRGGAGEGVDALRIGGGGGQDGAGRAFESHRDARGPHVGGVLDPVAAGVDPHPMPDLNWCLAADQRNVAESRCLGERLQSRVRVVNDDGLLGAAGGSDGAIGSVL